MKTWAASWTNSVAQRAPETKPAPPTYAHKPLAEAKRLALFVAQITGQGFTYKVERVPHRETLYRVRILTADGQHVGWL